MCHESKPRLALIWRGISALLLLAGAALPQAEMQGMVEGAAPFFNLDLVAFQSERAGHSRLEVFLKVPFDELQFVRQPDQSFRAIYEVSVVVLEDEQDGFQVDGRIWQDTVRVTDFEQTNSRRDLSFSETAFDLKPGKYRLTAGLLDLDTRTTAYRKGKIALPDFAQAELALSDVLLADAIDQTSDGRYVPRPQVAAPRQERSELFAYFEIYDHKPTAQYDFTYWLKDGRGKKVLEKKDTVASSGNRTQVILRLPSQDLSHGMYTIRIQVARSGQHAESERQLALYWEGIPATVGDLNEAIEQLRYFAKKDDLNKIKKAPDDQRRQAFLDYWRSKDPTPGTDQNELMDEYYRRIQYANMNFNAFREGWKSDMGMVYVIFGPPNDIERNPYNLTSSFFSGRTIKAYEIWNYYNENRQFIFVDETGYGEYRLYYPISIDQYLR